MLEPLALPRRLLDRSVAGLAGFAAAAACLLFLAILAVTAFRAAGVLSLELMLAPMRDGGTSGGLRDQLLGTLLLATTSLALALPLGAALAVSAEVLAGRRLGRTLRLGLYTANGIPSILYGVVAFAVFVQWLGWGKSWLAGGLTLGLMAVPTVAIALGEAIAALPARYLDAGRALGLPRDQLIRRIVWPQTRLALVTGGLLGVARAAGETAPILFAAAVFSGASLPPTGVREQPVLALPYHVFTLAQDAFDPGARMRLWGAATLLLLLAIGFALLALPLRLATTEAHHG